MAHALRFLALDAVEKAGSGHPGLPMGMADVATVLWTRFLRHSPKNPHWYGRDRFVLSAGHGSMLLYGLLHLSGYQLSLEDLKSFRQLDSATPGHPEYGETPGVEVSTGPLGQGFANAVGMALAERQIATRFPNAAPSLVEHRTFVLASDGDLMEGISHEAASLAGHLALGKLIVLHDANQISIDGPLYLTCSDDVAQRFAAYHWQVQQIDGHDHNAIAAALEHSLADRERPSLICCRTTIGYGSPARAGKASAHGAPFGTEEIAATRQALAWPWPPFVIPPSILEAWRQALPRGEAWERTWEAQLKTYTQTDPREAAALRVMSSPKVETTSTTVEKAVTREETSHDVETPNRWLQEAKTALAPLIEPWQKTPPKPMATRAASKVILETLTPAMPALLGGSADLSGSNGTYTSAHRPLTAADPGGNYLYYGVREHAMGAIMNGLALHGGRSHGGVLPYGGTFLVFSDYLRPALRMAALMRLQVIHVFTHDSLGVGEDGPTHQPVEHYAALRAIPRLQVLRPADARETLGAWLAALAYLGPSALLLSRQTLPNLEGSSAEGVERGGYVLRKAPCTGDLRVLLIGTGSELQLACEAQAQLAQEGIGAQVVSMPCLERFAAQPKAWQEAVLPPQITARVVVEAGVLQGWERLLGPSGRMIGMADFGASAPADSLFTHFGLTVAAVVDAARAQL